MTRQQISLRISRREWDRIVPLSTDRVCVRNLSINAPVALDGWGRDKPQPVQISVSLSLAQSFASAAERDKVDQSTIHYGQLSKNVLAAIEADRKQQISLDELARLVEEAASRTISFPALAETLEVDIFLPKASLLGAGVGFQYCRAFGNPYRLDVARVVHVKDLAIPTVIGVNSHERDMKQQVVVNVWIDRLAETISYNEIEQLVVKTVEESAFETLETLATKAVSILIKHFVFRVCPGVEVRIRVEKPSAVTLAEAPGIEIVRQTALRDAFASRLWSE
ncbi:MAG: hypothetical protein M1837_000739, partial [Sclerophora amabilis]